MTLSTWQSLQQSTGLELNTADHGSAIAHYRQLPEMDNLQVLGKEIMDPKLCETHEPTTSR